MNVIVCVDNNWGIGKNNGLLFHLPKDLQYFKEKTKDKVVVMGGNTLLSLPGSKPLPKRKNIVLCDEFERSDCTVVDTIEELKIELKKYNSEDIFIIGGAMFYATMLDYCDKAYVTKVDSVCDDATVFFPNLDDKPNWIIKSIGEPLEDQGYITRYYTYVNNNKKSFL
ncbi:MAG: dihydrofolate reductase [Christensenellales bacterium]|jgi:dihydrofolate reductase|nr:dihydrofolate reductase [Clostridiales bacterium]